MLWKIIFSTLITLSLAACSSLPGQQSSYNAEPDWVKNSHLMDGVVGVGSAKTHLKGPAAQRALATSRALDEIARQKGVSVSNVVARRESMTATRASSSMQTASQQVVNNNQVHAVIKGEWNNGDELFILMVAE